MAFCKAIARRSQKVTFKNDHLDVKFFFGQQVSRWQEMESV